MNQISPADAASREAARRPDGRFGEQPHADPGQVVPADNGWPDTEVNNHLRTICDDAGLPVMQEVLGIVAERDRIHDHVFTALTAADVEGFYYSAVGPLIDDIQGSLDTGEDGPADGGPDVQQHVAAVCTEAGDGWMTSILQVVIDRGETPDATLLALTPDDISSLCEFWVEGALDNVEEQVAFTQPDAWKED